MKSYKELIMDDLFNPTDSYLVNTHLTKMCWGCETKYKIGYMVRDNSKLRRIFFCENCYKKLK